MTESARFFSLGDRQEVTATRQQHAHDTFEAAYQTAVKQKTHLWIATIMHRASETFLDVQDGRTGELALLDADTVAMAPMVGCYVCEQTYEARLRRRRCPGEPASTEARGTAGP